MRKRARLATTAGVTVLGFTAMSGMGGTAHADSGGLGLPGDLTGTLGKTVDGVLKPVTDATKPHLQVKVPVKVRLGVPASGPSSPAVKARVKAGVKVSAGPLSVRAGVNVRLCAPCGRRPAPPSPIPPAPPTPPPAPPVMNPIPAPPGAGKTPAAGSLTVLGNALPFTGGPIGALAFLGVAAIVTGAAGVAGSRLKTARSA
jgi:hypothetical protein